LEEKLELKNSLFEPGEYEATVSARDTITGKESAESSKVVFEVQFDDEEPSVGETIVEGFQAPPL